MVNIPIFAVYRNFGQMESTVANAFLLLAVGMITVFLILLLVVGLGSVLIKLTNSRYKAPQKMDDNRIPAKTIAVLTAVVDHLTAGKGTIEAIEKN